MNYPQSFPSILERLNKLSFLAMGYSTPNPPVACLITDLEGNILSEGFTQRAGENHAEREAYQSFALKFSDAKSIPHLVFVTLEPCTHFGKTPPCIDLILEYKPVCVYYGLTDPNPLVKNRDGKKECKIAGIEFIKSPEIERLGLEYLSGFISRINNKRPQVFIKSALSQEGFYADLEKSRIFLSNEKSNEVTQMLRAKLDAVIVGPITVYVDYPGLDFRGFEKKPGEQNIFQNTKSNAPETKFNFTETLIPFTFESSSKDWHNTKLTEYQPYRVFVLSLKKIPDQLFFKKQSVLSEKFGKEKTLFFLLDHEDENFTHEKYCSIMREISSQELIIVKNKSELLDRLFAKFSELSLNTVLVEGGNLLYKIFSEKMEAKDLIYFIRSNKHIEKGISPEIDLLNLKKQIEIQIDTDTWEIYGV
jgi:diaminohydroxyphosphoribosylaminopyrimidine deaminase/5-amino-6-(5-phosphoribosylamino)uracil reductase